MLQFNIKGFETILFEDLPDIIVGDNIRDKVEAYRKDPTPEVLKELSRGEVLYRVVSEQTPVMVSYNEGSLVILGMPSKVLDRFSVPITNRKFYPITPMHMNATGTIDEIQSVINRHINTYAHFIHDFFANHASLVAFYDTSTNPNICNNCMRLKKLVL